MAPNQCTAHREMHRCDYPADHDGPHSSGEGRQRWQWNTEPVESLMERAVFKLQEAGEWNAVRLLLEMQQ